MHSMCNRKKGKLKLVQDSPCVADWFMIISRKDSHRFWYSRVFRNTWGQAAVSLRMWLQHLFSASTADGDHYHISLQVFAGSRTVAARGRRCWQLFSSHKHTPGVHISLHIKSPPTAGNLYMLHASTGASICNLPSSCSSFHCYSCCIYQRAFKRL